MSKGGSCRNGMIMSPSFQRRRRCLGTSFLFFMILVLNACAAFSFQTATRTRFVSSFHDVPKAFGNHHLHFDSSQRTSYQPPTFYEDKRSSLFQSDFSSEAESFSTTGFSVTVNANLVALQRMFTKAGRTLPFLLSAAAAPVIATLQKCWWCLPMFLALVPPYCALVHGTSATTPSWWALVKLDSVLHSPYAAFILGFFLLSNISYFISGIYLYLRYHHFVPAVEARDPLLGGSVMTAGAVSTVFHSVQALGPHSVAECLCYIDHGVAISSILYFWCKCGRPSRTTWLLSILGLATLCLSGPGYAWLHSVWHVLSAAAAVVWARDGLDAQTMQM